MTFISLQYLNKGDIFGTTVLTNVEKRPLKMYKKRNNTVNKLSIWPR